MTCDFQGMGEQGNLKQHGLPLGAVPFRGLVSIMAFRGISPFYLFTLEKPSMPPPGLKSNKFPLLAMAQRSFSLYLGTLHCSFLNQPTASGPELPETRCLMKNTHFKASLAALLYLSSSSWGCSWGTHRQQWAHVATVTSVPCFSSAPGAAGCSVVYSTFSTSTGLFLTAIPNKLQHRPFYPEISMVGVVQGYPHEKLHGEISPETPAMRQHVVCWALSAGEMLPSATHLLNSGMRPHGLFGTSIGLSSLNTRDKFSSMYSLTCFPRRAQGSVRWALTMVLQLRHFVMGTLLLIC